MHVAQVRVALGLLAAIATAHPAAAQQQAVSDSMLVVLTASAVIRELSAPIAEAQIAGVARPWTVEVPKSGSALWSDLAERLADLLGARPAMPQDTSYELRISRVQMHGDTLVAHFQVNAAWPCTAPGEVNSYGTGYESRIVRYGSAWVHQPLGPLLRGHGRC